MEATTETTYFNRRLQQLQLDAPPTINLLPFYMAEWPAHQAAAVTDEEKAELEQTPWFSEDENGNIKLLYLNPNGTKVIYRGDSRWGKHYTRLRLHPANITGDAKYSQPPKSGIHLFFTPNVIDAYTTSTQINTLVLVEGEFKAFAGNSQGLHIIGLPSIWGFKEKDAPTLHPDLLAVIDRCKPKNIVLLHDADALQVKWDEWQANPDKDLGKRLNSFCSAVLKFREMVKPLSEKTDFYYCHIKEDWLLNKTPNGDTVKGLDDLYLYLTEKEAQNATESIADISPSHFFNFINLSTCSGAKIKEHFLVKRGKRGEPQSFFQKYKDTLGELPFVFEGSTFKYNGDIDILEYVKHRESEKFVRIGCDYYKNIYKPDQFGNMEREMKAWKKGEITEDYVKGMGLVNFFKDIPKYDSACNVPSHTDFKQVIGNSYNLYHPVDHKPEPGEWPTIAYYLNHVFGEHIQFGLDYIKLLWEKPTQKLPILAFISAEQGTGKSLFIEFMKLLFRENAVMIGNNEISDGFNSDFLSKLVIGIDEGLIEKRAVLEKIKSWTTSNKVQMNEKNVARISVNFIGKIIFTSNNVDNFIYLDEEDRRFFVRELSKPEHRDPFLLDKMMNEVEAFLFYLMKRPMFYENKDQLYFERTVYATEAKRRVIQNSKTWVEQDMRELIVDLFSEYGNKVMYLTLSEILGELKARNANYKPKEVRSFLIKQKVELMYGAHRRKHWREPETPHDTMVKQRYWCFHAGDWLNEEELADFFTQPETQTQPF